MTQIKGIKNTSILDFNKISKLVLLFFIALLPIFFAKDIIPDIVQLSGLADQPSPYFIPEYFFLLYIASPVVILSSCLLLLLPGLFISLMLNAAVSVEKWLLYSLGLSIVVISAVIESVEAALLSPLLGDDFLLAVFLISLFCLFLLLIRLRRGSQILFPVMSIETKNLIYSIIIVPFILIAVLTPKLFWENFNGDGMHAYESSRLLLFQAFPFWDPATGALTSFPGITSALFTYPASWFIRIFGEFEVAARLPYILFITALFGAIVTLIKYGKHKQISITEVSLIWAALVIYTITMGYSASYNPYFADFALPATQDTLQILSFLGFIIAFLDKKPGWLLLFVVLTYTSLPSGLLLMFFWCVAVLLLVRPVPWKILFLVAGYILLIIVSSMLFKTYSPFLNSSGEYEISGFLNRFAFLQVSDWRRLTYILVPTGFIPVLALLFWRRQDTVTRAITLVIVVYFLFFYLQAYISLHHFSLVMILPIIVLWRTDIAFNQFYYKYTIILVLTGIIAGLVMAFPDNTQVNTHYRKIGKTMYFDVKGYHEMKPGIFRSIEVMNDIITFGSDVRVPDKLYYMPKILWLYYSQGNIRNNKNNYILKESNKISPSDSGKIYTRNGYSLIIRNLDIMKKDLAIRPDTPPGSRVFTIPRKILFGNGLAKFNKRPYLIDVSTLRKK